MLFGITEILQIQGLGDAEVGCCWLSHGVSQDGDQLPLCVVAPALRQHGFTACCQKITALHAARHRCKYCTVPQEGKKPLPGTNLSVVLHQNSPTSEPGSVQYQSQLWRWPRMTLSA